MSTRGKYLTYDGNKFDNTGNCRYVLSQDCVGSQFSIEVQYEANKKKFYRRAVFLRLDCIEVEVNYDGMVKVNKAMKSIWKYKTLWETPFEVVYM